MSKHSELICLVTIIDNIYITYDYKKVHDGVALFMFQSFMKDPADAAHVHWMCPTKDEEPKYATHTDWMCATEDEDPKQPEVMFGVRYFEASWQIVRRCAHINEEAR